MRCLQERIYRIKLDDIVDNMQTHTHTHTHAPTQGNYIINLVIFKRK